MDLLLRRQFKIFRAIFILNGVFILILTLSWITITAIRVSTIEWTRHSIEVTNQIETTRRAYEESYLAARSGYTEGNVDVAAKLPEFRGNFYEQLAKLKTMVRDNPEQTKACELVLQAAQVHFKAQDTAIKAYQAGGINYATEVGFQIKLIDQLKNVLELFHQVSENEQSLLLQRFDHGDTIRSLSTYITFMMLTLIFANKGLGSLVMYSVKESIDFLMEELEDCREKGTSIVLDDLGNIKRIMKET